MSGGRITTPALSNDLANISPEGVQVGTVRVQAAVSDFKGRRRVVIGIAELNALLKAAEALGWNNAQAWQEQCLRAAFHRMGKPGEHESAQRPPV